MFTNFFIFTIFFIFPLAKSQTLATISYSNSKGPVTVTITTNEFRTAYNQMKQMAPNAPPAKQFWDDYLLYRIGVEQAYNDRSLVKDPSMRHMFSNRDLKESFEQTLYKILAENKLRTQIAQVDTATQKLSQKTMFNFYKNNPEFDINFIVITMPAQATPAQINAAKKRATSIYQEIRKSKRPFARLVDLYSDDRISGQLNITRTRQTIYPTVYNQLKKMKPGQISTPIRTPGGFHIVKLNRVIPFAQANQTQIKTAYFDQRRGQIISQYFNKLKKNYKINVNTAALNTVR